MLAFGITIVLFNCLTIFGLAVLPKKLFLGKPLIALGLSSVMGISVVTLQSFTISRLGIPLKYFHYFFIIDSIISILILIRNKNYLSEIKASLKYFVFGQLGILVSAWPMLKYGFGWLSYTNDDMNNYVLSAMRLYHQGFFEVANQKLFDGKDYSQVFYYFNTLKGIRSGSEIFLASVSNLNHGQVLSIFMVAIFILQLALLANLNGLISILFPNKPRLRFIGYLLTLSFPLLNLGVLYQLIAQVGGLAISLSIFLIIATEKRTELFSKSKTYIPLLILLLSALLIWYPEITVFTLPGIFIIFLFKQNRSKLHASWQSIVALFLAILILNRYILDAVNFLLSQMQAASKQANGINMSAQLFPYFLKPHGLIALLGFEPINRWFSEPWESLFIALSFAILVFIVIKIVRSKSEIIQNHFTLIWMLLILPILIYKEIGFGAFKLSMYAAPYLILGLLYLLNNEVVNSNVPVRFKRRKVAYLGILATLLICNIRTTSFYVGASTGGATNGFSEVQGGSETGIAANIHRAVSAEPKTRVIVSPTYNLSAMKLEDIATRGWSLIQPTTNIWDQLGLNETNLPYGLIRIQDKIFNFANDSLKFSQISSYNYLDNNQAFLLNNNPRDAINHYSNRNFIKPWQYSIESNLHNYLMFIDSSKGYTYYSWEKSRTQTALYLPERNPMVPGTYMQAFGNYLLFEIIHPSAKPMLILGDTNTVLSQYSRALPKVEIYGENVKDVTSVGRGSARTDTLLPPPKQISGHYYYLIHILQSTLPQIQKQSAVASVYGRAIQNDSRRIAIFVNNLSVLDSAEITVWDTPKNLSNFPTDLENEKLFYSGIYEDGWIAKDSYFDLDSANTKNFTITGQVPILPSQPKFTTELSVLIDGKKALVTLLNPGEFSKTVSITNMNLEMGTHRVELHFSKEQMLPLPDGRPASAHVTELGFK